MKNLLCQFITFEECLDKIRLQWSQASPKLNKRKLSWATLQSITGPETTFFLICSYFMPLIASSKMQQTVTGRKKSRPILPNSLLSYFFFSISDFLWGSNESHWLFSSTGALLVRHSYTIQVNSSQRIMCGKQAAFLKDN